MKRKSLGWMCLLIITLVAPVSAQWKGSEAVLTFTGDLRPRSGHSMYSS